MPLTKQLSSSGSMSDPSQEDEEVFEITDFTNASDWEKFIAQLEESITEWQLNHYIKFLPLTLNELANGEWEVLNSTINYSSVTFNLSLHRLKQKENTEQYLEEKEDEDDFHLPQYADDIMNIENDFPPRAHCLARWYGLRCFLVLMPGDQVQTTINHSKSNLLRSSANIALHNTSCDVPLFMQIKDSWQRLYVGCAVSQGVSTNFEIACLKRVPAQYAHVSGLSYIFKTKLGVPGLSSDKLHVSARFTYVLDDWGSDRRWPDKAISQEEIAKNFKSLPHGCIEEPVNGLTLAAVWPSTTGDGVSDNDVQQGFDALSAPEWTMRLQYADNVPFMLSYSLSELLKVLSSLDTMADLMNPQPPADHHRDIGHALDRITDPMTKSVLSPIVSPKLAEGISKVVSNSQNFIKRGAVSIGRMTVAGERIPRELVEEIKTFLFSEDGGDSAEPNAKQLTYMQVKAAPRNSFSYRLAVCATVLNLCYGGIWALAQLWHMVMTELRTYLDSGKCIPGLDSVGPDHRSCLIHQKLQMLNCCISRKKAREAYNNMQQKSEEAAEEECKDEEQVAEEVEISVENIELVESESSENVESKVTAVTDDASATNLKQASVLEDSDDEFFECDDGSEDDQPAEEDPVTNEQQASEDDEIAVENTSDHASSNDEKTDEQVTEDSEQRNQQCEGDHLQPEGRLKQLDNLKLLHRNTPLYIPVTQDHALLTEDQLEEQAEIFSNLGDTKEGSKVRAKMQSVSLEADMSAFKAANPGCSLEDFVRWYSPRDFENGALSTRMLIPDNLWVTTWNAAPAIPAHRQKRLFDDTKEAEKVLHFLANLKPSQVAQLILPICIYDSLLRLRSYRDTLSEVLPSLPPLCNQVEQKAARLFRNWTTTNPPLASSVDLGSPVNELIRQIGFAEKIIERARSLLHKFSALDNQADMNTFVRELLEHPEIRVEGAANGRVGKIVRRFFFMQQEKAQKSADKPNVTPAPIQPLPDPFGREFILRCVIRHPTDFSQKLPQRLYAVLMRNEFRLASAISTDSTFF